MAKKKKSQPAPNTEPVHYAIEEETICCEYTGVAENEAPILHTTLKENVTCVGCLEELREIKSKKKEKITDWTFTGTN